MFPLGSPTLTKYAQKSFSECVSPVYERVSGKAYRLQNIAPNLYVLRLIKNYMVHAKSTISANTEVRLKLPTSLVANVFPLQRRQHQLVVMPATITSIDHEDPVRITIMNHSSVDKKLEKGLAIAAFSLLPVAHEAAIREVHPEEGPDDHPLDFAEAVMAGRRSLAVARQEAMLLGLTQDYNSRWSIIEKTAAPLLNRGESGYHTDTQEGWETVSEDWETEPQQDPIKKEPETFPTPWGDRLSIGFSII